MITNLFSSFDPISSLTSWQLNWIRTFLILAIFFPLFWISFSKSNFMFSEITSYITKEFIPLFKRFKNVIFFNVLFIFIFINNIFGLMPYVFTRTAHIAMTLSIALTICQGRCNFFWWEQEYLKRTRCSNYEHSCSDSFCWQ